ncbi:MAG TPA: HAMP domain-containing sensor histidine kinase [Devosiaceae bacterium]|jgi:signal transduction histidine kinase
MTGPTVRRKWRPTLGMVVFAVLLSVLALPAAMVVGFRALDATTSRMGPVEYGAMAVALLLTLIVAYVLTRTVTAPIDALIRRSHEIGVGGRTAIQPLGSYGTREVATLSQSFLDLAGRLVDRTEYVQSFAAHVSHELKSPLTAIRGAAELLRDEDTGAAMSPEERRRFLDHIIADADRLSALLGRLRELARAEVPFAGGATTPTALAEGLALRFPVLTIAVHGATTLPLALSPEAASIVFGQLAENAAQHGAKRLDITATLDERGMTLVVADDGTGISEGNRALVFQPFFTTRREEGGTGMGLDIARAMLQAHGGAIRLIEAKKGAAFEIVVPLNPQEA